jgi:hypothetical protein
MAITEYYVSTTGAGTNSGLSEANAMTWAQMVTDINGGSAAGRRYNVKAGTYSLSAVDTLNGNGTATSPIWIRGYSSTIGDATLGRTDGVLNTANMPDIVYGANFRLNCNGTFVVVESLDISGNNAGFMLQCSQDGGAINCRVVNASTSGSAYAVGVDAARATCVNCDLAMTGASGGTCVANVGSSGGLLAGCRIYDSPTHGVRMSSTGVVANNVIHGCDGAGIYSESTNGSESIFGNTVYGCGANGIETITSSTTLRRIIGNHVTDCTGYGIDLNNAASAAIVAYNRTRDNTTAATFGGTDWVTASNIGNVTTDNGAAASDYVDAAGGDFALAAGAVGVQAGCGNKLPIGACGPDVIGGGGLRGYAFA